VLTGLYSNDESFAQEEWMPRIAFDELPEDARVWIFSAERKLAEAERTRLLAEVDAFIDQWGAHAMPLTAGRDLVYDQFLFIAVDQRAAGPSGCSIDALVRQMKGLQDEIGVELVNHAPVLFRQGEAIARVPREAFAELAEAGKLIERDAMMVRSALLGALEDEDEETAVRRRALEAIAPVRHPDVPGWIRWAYQSGEPLLRQSAVYAMGRTCDPAWLPVVVAEFGSSVPAMRFEAANAARELADPKTLPYLHELTSDDDPQVALAAVHAVGGIGGTAARKLLKHYVEQEDPTLSEAAQEALRALEADEGDFSMLTLQEP